ncbi:MAG: hypothetical protein QF541_19200, partial [Lentisphaeria bacterium]|nr:hypothetical protein [Lentisphaeria bacterium]
MAGHDQHLPVGIFAQQSREAEVEVIEVEAEALPNNVVNLSDYRGATFEPSLGAASLEKSQKMSKVLG